jgi:hypothetical protein
MEDAGPITLAQDLLLLEVSVQQASCLSRIVLHFAKDMRFSVPNTPKSAIVELPWQQSPVKFPTHSVTCLVQENLRKCAELEIDSASIS